MGNFGKEALTPDIQLTFTCFLKKRFFWRLALTLGTGGSIILLEFALKIKCLLG